MALNPEPAHPDEREAHDLPPKSYAEAAEEGLQKVNGVDGTKEQDEQKSTTTGPLNPEPALPEEREAQNLPPKSYADAVEEDSPKVNGVDGTNDGNEKNSLPATPLDSEPALPEEREAQNLPPKSYAEAADPTVNGVDNAKTRVAQNVTNIQTNGKITIPSRESPEQYEGEGQDGSPRTPVKHSYGPGHRRRSSQQSTGSPKRRTSHSIDHIYEKHVDEKGRSLTTVKPGKDLQKDHRIDKKPIKQQKEALVAGRQAGAGWEKSRIRFAPLNVPLRRRLQTLAVLMHTLSIAGTMTIFFGLCSIPIFWPLLFPYVMYVLFSNAGTSGELSFRSERWRRSPVWSLFASYFPARLYRSQELPPTRKYIFGYHPHGIISHGCWAAFATEALGFSQLFPGITNTVLTLDSNFRLPVYREYALRMGLASVSRESCENILSKGGRNGEGMGRAITIVIGGARESLEAQPGHLRLILRCRKGFVKLAIRTGADLVPVLAFGENEIYEQFDPQAHPMVHRVQMLVKKFMGFTIPLFHARGVFNYDVGMMPYRRPMNIVVGKPIQVVQNKQPDAKYVDEVHKQYMEELQRLWDDWKDTFAKERLAELEIIE
jgi:2-acylglycerol O-acyltransferase 2